MSGITSDAGGLIALDQNDRRVITLLARAMERELARAIRNPARQVRLSRLIRQSCADLIALDGPGASAAGLLLARTGTAYIVDAHVVVCARKAGQPVISSDVDDLWRIAPELDVIGV